MAKGQRHSKMVSDERLELLHDPAEIVTHPTKPGYTLACRNCGNVNEGNWAEKPSGYSRAIWWCSKPECQEALIRHQKIHHWRQLGSPALDGDVSDFISDVE